MLLPKRKRTFSPDPMSVVSRFVEAANRHDAEGVESCLHPDFESIQPTHPDRNFKGSRQVRRNWQAIFQAEPGFRLTVLRSSVTDDTAWVELHGAGEAAEVAGVLIFGVENGRLRWSRIYSEMVEQPMLATDGSAEPAPAPAAATPTSDPTRPVFEVIQGEGGRPDAPEADAGAGEDAADPAGQEAVDDEGGAAEAPSTARGDGTAVAGDTAAPAEGEAATETLVGSESAAPIDTPAVTGDEAAGDDAAEVAGATDAAELTVEGAAGETDAAELTVEGAAGEPEATTEAEGAPAPKATRKRKPRAAAPTSETRPRRTRKKST